MTQQRVYTLEPGLGYSCNLDAIRLSAPGSLSLPSISEVRTQLPHVHPDSQQARLMMQQQHPGHGGIL